MYAIVFLPDALSLSIQAPDVRRNVPEVLGVLAPQPCRRPNGG
jgi:hypothetical protein